MNLALYRLSADVTPNNPAVLAFGDDPGALEDFLLGDTALRETTVKHSCIKTR